MSEEFYGFDDPDFSEENMLNRGEKMLISTEDAIDEVTRLERTIGFVRATDTEGIDWRNRLVDGLVNACNAHGVVPKPIIDRCLELSKHCPTDYDLHTVAGIIREETRSTEPEPASRGCARCHGTGWERVFSLHTMEGEGEFSYKRRDQITRQVYESIQRKLGPNQETHTGVRRCDHRTAEPEWTHQERAEHDAKWEAFCADPANRKLLRGLGDRISSRLGIR